MESHRIRTARLNYGQPTYRDLNEQLSNMKEDEKSDLAVRFRAYRAKIAKNEDSSVVPSTAHSKIVGENALTLSASWILGARSL